MTARRVAAVDVLSARRKRQLLVVAALLLAFGGHLLFWYVPRERSAVLDGRSLSGQIFFDSGLANRVWLPYPHQNIARLSHAVEDPSEWALAVVRLLGSSPGFSRLPRFGPCVLPPSRSLTVATDRSGERFVMAAEIYPIIAVVARLAGRLAGNPLLAGGEVTLDGRPFWVSWRDGVWLLCSTDDEIIFTPSSRRLGPTLAVLEIEAAGGVLPSGRYGLRRWPIT